MIIQLATFVLATTVVLAGLPATAIAQPGGRIVVGKRSVKEPTTVRFFTDPTVRLAGTVTLGLLAVKHAIQTKSAIGKARAVGLAKVSLRAARTQLDALRRQRPADGSRLDGASKALAAAEVQVARNGLGAARSKLASGRATLLTVGGALAEMDVRANAVALNGLIGEDGIRALIGEDGIQALVGEDGLRMKKGSNGQLGLEMLIGEDGSIALDMLIGEDGLAASLQRASNKLGGDGAAAASNIGAARKRLTGKVSATDLRRSLGELGSASLAGAATIDRVRAR
jgi:hypothetical protein